MNKRFAISVMVLGLGCGDDGDDSSKNAPEKCRMLLDAFCERAASCRAESGDATSMEDAVDQCHESFMDQDIDCAEAVQAPSNLDQCFEDLDAAACKDLVVLDDGTLANVPASCGQ